MSAHSVWGITPRQSIEAECNRRGRDNVVAGCMALICGGKTDAGLLFALAGPGAAKFLNGGPHDDVYWLRVWGARGLLWAWDGTALEALKLALGDDAWRVREIALKVVARHYIDEVVSQVVELRNDPIARVRAAAQRAIDLLMVDERS